MENRNHASKDFVTPYYHITFAPNFECVMEKDNRFSAIVRLLPGGMFAYKFVILSVIVGLVLRIVLILNPHTVLAFTAVEWLKIFLLGAVNDVCFALLALVPYFIIILGFGDRKYARPWGWVIEVLLVAAVVYVWFLPSIFNEYGGGAPKIAKAFFTYKLVSFTLRLLVPKIRATWRCTVMYVTMFMYVFCLLFNCIGEYFFWNEFGVRYNFIAVDYLVYTNEVIGNIFESYPVVPMIAALVAIACVGVWLLVRRSEIKLRGLWNLKTILITVLAYAALLVCSCYVLTLNRQSMGDDNLFATELQSNGGFDFYLAFRSNELKYDQFYPMLTQKQCAEEYQKLIGNKETAADSLPAQKKNIVLITVESLSGEYLKAYGNRDGITPNLDTLMNHSLVMDNLFAVGNRTVRGLEALSLCKAPSAGESIIKRPGNTGLHTVGSILKKQGYTVQFLYGGDSYFDNMGEYFGGNGYQVIDRKDFAPDEVTFANIWGTCDEDAFRKSLRVMDKDAGSGKPFFMHIMTISNHRPFTYPAGKIKVAGDPKSRDGGVKYTDYAIGEFLRAARSKAWFRNTVFIIVADHCASSAGSVDIPIENYHIPAIVYAPGFVRPQRISTLCSQIDLMPTVLSMLHIGYSPRLMGQNILSPTFRPRAFMATYQNLGYFDGHHLTVLSPVRRIDQYAVSKLQDGTYAEKKMKHQKQDDVITTETYYQYSNKHN